MPVKTFVPTSRVPALWPFDTDSIWNLPIADGATFQTTGDAATAALISATHGAPWVNQADYSHPVYHARHTDPVTTVADFGHSHAVNPGAGALQGGNFAYRVPADAGPADAADGHMHVVDPTGRYCDEAIYVERNAVTPTLMGCSRSHRVDLLGMGVGPMQGTRAYGGPAIGGLVRSWEIDPTHPLYTGVIRHPLSIALKGAQMLRTSGGAGYNSAGYGTGLGYVWPATEQDGSSSGSYTGSIPMGSYVAIPPAVNLGTLGIATAAAMMIAVAMQDYGAYVTDTAGAVILAYVETTAPTAWAIEARSNSSADLALIRNQLRVVTNNALATPNGGALGAARRQPLAPEVTL